MSFGKRDSETPFEVLKPFCKALLIRDYLAQVCYAYLADVGSGDSLYSDLKKSNWFTRGWTLQELLAPSSVIFFDYDWNDVGTKGSLEELISKVTGIDDFVNFETACVAQKMSWAANRETTRIEDKAYCLLGLFDVNMPPLYGEGEKAFMRLQLEILKTSDDESIFAWGYCPDLKIKDLPSRGLLASSPTKFKNSGKVRPLKREVRESILFKENHPFSMTNKGLYISLLLIPKNTFDQNLFIAPLKCSWAHTRGKSEGSYPAIHLQRKVVNGVEKYRRVTTKWGMGPEGLTQAEDLLLLEHEFIQDKLHQNRSFYGLPIDGKYIYIKDVRRDQIDTPTPLQGWLFSVNPSSLMGHGFMISRHAPLALSCNWDDSTEDKLSLTIKFINGIVAGVLFVNHETNESIVLVIIVGNGRPHCLLVLIPDPNQALEEIIGSLQGLCIETVPRVRQSTSNSSNSTAHSLNPMESVSSSDSDETFDNVDRIPKRRPPLDRMSRRLINGKSVSASMRHVTTEGNGRRFLINIEIYSRGAVRWPAPAWVDLLLLLVSMKEMRIKEQKQQTGTSK
jgi:hypothetical protein